MESYLNAPKTLFQIVLGSTVHAEWTTFLKKIRVLGSGAFAIVYLAEDPSSGKQYVVKEVFTQGKPQKTQQLLLDEPEKLSKVRKYKHPNLQNLITWFKDPNGGIVTVIEYKKGQTLLEYVEGFKRKQQLISYEVVIFIFS